MQAKTSLFSTPPRGTRLFAAVLLLALSGAFVAVAQAQTTGTPSAPAMHGFDHGGPGGGRMLERMLDSVNASADQRSRIHEIMKSAMTDLQAQRQASRGLREQLATLFAQPTVDARAVEAVRQQMLQQHDQSSRRWMQAMLDASVVLTPEQRVQLAERMKQGRDMMQRHHQERSTLEQPKG
jgi:Spy/CpxP family protein refolding chaperone